MVPYNGDLTRSLKWMQNNAPNIQALVNQKAQWYGKYNDQFWENWRTTVFDLRTANAFGLAVWCIILGLPLSAFNFEPLTNAWAFGAARGNYQDGGGHTLPFTFIGSPAIQASAVTVPPANYTINATAGQITFSTAPIANAPLTWTGSIQNPITGQTLVVQTPRKFGVGDGTTKTFNLYPSDSDDYYEVGANFYGGGSASVASLNEIRFACQLRYAALVSNGRVKWINQMLAYIFNGGAAWDFPNKKYFYLADSSLATQNVTGATLYANGVAIPAANYTLNPATGAVVFSTAPATGSVLTWSGGWYWATANAQQFGTGDGTTTAFTLTKPPGAALPVTTPYYMEYRIGANMGLSAQFLNLLNTASYGIMPTCAGIRYQVVQES
jgi:hypothetical protein